MRYAANTFTKYIPFKSFFCRRQRREDLEVGAPHPVPQQHVPQLQPDDQVHHHHQYPPPPPPPQLDIFMSDQEEEDEEQQEEDLILVDEEEEDDMEVSECSAKTRDGSFMTKLRMFTKKKFTSTPTVGRNVVDFIDVF